MGQKCRGQEKLFSCVGDGMWWLTGPERKTSPLFSHWFSHSVRHMRTDIDVTSNVRVGGGTGVKLGEVQGTPVPQNPSNHTALKSVLVGRVLITLKIKGKVSVSRENLMLSKIMHSKPEDLRENEYVRPRKP